MELKRVFKNKLENIVILSTTEAGRIDGFLGLLVIIEEIIILDFYYIFYSKINFM